MQETSYLCGFVHFKKNPEIEPFCLAYRFVHFNLVGFDPGNPAMEVSSVIGC
jgi:hypothetical protein